MKRQKTTPLVSENMSDRSRKEMRTIEFFVYENSIGLDIFGPLDVFAAATDILRKNGDQQSGYNAVFSAKKPGLVRLNSGVCVHADSPVGKGGIIDMLIVPGGLNVDQVTRDIELIDRIRSRATHAKQIISICGGVFILAACGLLKGKNVTTHWSVAGDLARLYPEITVNPDAIYIQDGTIFTSAGVTAGIDLALALVEEHHGFSLAMQVARTLVVYLRRPGGQSQFSSPMELRGRAGKIFSELHDWILVNLKNDLTVDSLAHHVSMSPRNFSRLFSKTTGLSPAVCPIMLHPLKSH
jgi:transcriptional regulator GlxA family with amidase domain